MIRADIANELRRYTGRGTIRASELAAFLGDKNVSRIRTRYLKELESIDGKQYLIPDVAKSLKEKCVTR